MSDVLDLPRVPGPRSPLRAVFCNRTLNLRAIRAVGYDMDYTLVHYRVNAWEERAFAYLRQKLQEFGWPVADLEFPATFAMRGLVIDSLLGNIVKADRFGYVKRGYHGTRRIGFEEQRDVYGSVLVDLADPRWVFLNTFFSLSEAGMYAQLVDRLDARRLTEAGLGYTRLWTEVRHALDTAHAEGRLKAEIVERPDQYIDPDPDIALTLLDQKEAGKRLVLITNSEWPFTRDIMGHALDPYLPDGRTWRDLFDLTFVSARKPEFFSGRGALFEVVDDDGLVRPCTGGPTHPGVYLGGHAAMVEQYFGLSGSEFLYIGDHLYTDVRASKDVRRWRAGLIVRELEADLEAVAARRTEQQRLDVLMAEKATLEYEHARVRLQLQRLERRYGPDPETSREAIEGRLGAIRGRLEKLDDEIAPLANLLGALSNETWGPLMSTGATHSYLARQLEDSADIYMSRVSNLLDQTPYAFLRAPRGRLPHDEG